MNAMSIRHTPIAAIKPAPPPASGGRLPEALPAPFDKPPSPDGVIPGPETLNLVDGQVRALLERTPSYHALSTGDQTTLRERLVRISAYAAELVRDDWAQSRRLGQRPLVKTEQIYRMPEPPARQSSRPRAAGAKAPETGRRPDLSGAPAPLPAARALTAQGDFRSGATARIGEVTESTLRAIAFPTFVADLIKGSFDAIVGSTIKQMETFLQLISDVSKTVDQYMAENITDNQARDWLAQSYPHLMVVNTEDEEPRVETTEAGDEASAADLTALRGALNLPEPITSLDDTVIEEQLVPAARRKLAQSRLQMLSSMVMLGLQRIVVRHGRIRATMGFHIDASDRLHQESASAFDTSTQLSVSGFYYVAFSARTSITYVRSTRQDSDSALNVSADLTGEVDVTFETDYMPLNRLARAEAIERIRANTPNPEANTPLHGGISPPAARLDTGPSAASVVDARMRRLPAPSDAEIPRQDADAAANAGGAPATPPPATGGATPPADRQDAPGQTIGDTAGSVIRGAASGGEQGQMIGEAIGGIASDIAGGYLGG